MGSDVRFRPAAMNCSHRFFSLEAFFASAADSGFKAVELWTGPMHFFLDYASNDTPEKITRLANSFGLDVCALCPEQNNPKPANIAARGEESIKRTKDYFLRAINVASELGVGIVVVTPGWGFLDEERTEAWKRSVYMLGDLSSYATCKGIVLAVEALQPEESNLCNRLEAALSRFYLIRVPCGEPMKRCRIILMPLERMSCIVISQMRESYRIWRGEMARGTWRLIFSL